ncbi:hypothetical protein [Streptomyces decoyicus]|uniref:hypothetical protein n=1 Tax=Streptomyces decoyicus TaxID=249567 RepID=UPI0033BE75A5
MGAFGIQWLGAARREVAERFAPPTRRHTGPHGVPLLDYCVAWPARAITHSDSLSIS